jgi:hypothetical protein
MWPSSRWGQTPGWTRDKRRIQDHGSSTQDLGAITLVLGALEILRGSYSAALCRCIGMELLAAVVMMMTSTPDVGSSELCRQTPIYPRQYMLQGRKNYCHPSFQPRPGSTNGARLPLAAEHHAIPPSWRRGVRRDRAPRWRRAIGGGGRLGLCRARATIGPHPPQLRGKHQASTTIATQRSVPSRLVDGHPPVIRKA